MSEDEGLSSRKSRDHSKHSLTTSPTPSSSTPTAAKCSYLSVVLRKRESTSPKRIHQLLGVQKEMAVIEGRDTGQPNEDQEDAEITRQEVFGVSCTGDNMSSSGHRRVADVNVQARAKQYNKSFALGQRVQASELHARSQKVCDNEQPVGITVRPLDVSGKVRTRNYDVKKSGYDFKSVREKFENWSQYGPSLTVDYSLMSRYRGRSVCRSGRDDISKQSQSASSDRRSPCSVRSAPPSPGLVPDRITLSCSNPDLSRLQTSNYPSMLRRSSESLGVFRQSSDMCTIASRSGQMSDQTGRSSSQILIPGHSVSVKAAVAHFSKFPPMHRSETFRKSVQKPSLCKIKYPVRDSYNTVKSQTDDHETNTVFHHLLQVQPDTPQQITSNPAQNQTHEEQQTHSLDNWLQSVLQEKEMGKEEQDPAGSKVKQSLKAFRNPGDHGVEVLSQGKILTSEWSTPTKLKHTTIPKDTPTSQSCENVLSAEGSNDPHGTHSGKYSVGLTADVSAESLSGNPSFSFTLDPWSSSKEPPVTICVTQDPEDIETQYLSLSETDPHMDEELSTQHLPLSPRSSFGSVCSFKSSNADSAVDMNNPDEETSESVIENKVSHNQRSRRLSRQSRTSEAGSLSLDNCPSPTTSAPGLPKVYVSDHSGPSLSGSPNTLQQPQLDEKDLERIPRPWSPEDSAYSGNSDLSLDDTDEEEPPPPPKRKQSSWKIIRSIVRWSPFVQVFKKNKYPWIQLAGHQGNFQAGEAGAVLKKLDSREKQCYLNLMSDRLRPFVPEYRGDTEKNGDKYIQLQDLLCEFNTPCVMDIKMGCRTYLEEELEKARSKPTLRKDMYKKMIEVDPNAPSEEEREKEGVTKARYLQWRDEMSSSVNLGFRIEGIKKSDGSSSKDFKKTKTRDHVHEKLKSFIGENTNCVSQYIERLKAITSAQEESEFFQRHEVISSSLLFVHDSEKANVWMIDFGKTEPLPSNVKIDHRRTWTEGNHEDGYLAGLDRLISIFTDILNES